MGKFFIYKTIFVALLVLFVTNIVFGQNSKTVLVDFEDGEIPADWTIINNNNDDWQWRVLSGSYAHSGTHYVSTWLETNDDWLIPPKITPSAAEHTFSFWAKSANYNNEDFAVRLSTTGTNVSDFTVLLDEQFQIPFDYIEYSYDLTDYIGQDIYVAIICLSQNENLLCVDDVSYPSSQLTVDLDAWDMELDPMPVVDNQVTYTINVKNTGIADQNNYNVKLMQYVDGVNDVEMASATITETLSAGSTYSVNLNYMHTVLEDISVYGIVEVENDEDPDNDKTAIYDVSVQESYTVTFGDPPSWGYISTLPINFLPSASLTECIYMEDDLNIYPGMALNEIGYYTRSGGVGSESFTTYLRIWVGETDRTQLSDGSGVIPATEMTLVFEGDVFFPNDIQAYVPIVCNQNSFIYSGGNLVVMVDKPNETPHIGFSFVEDCYTDCSAGIIDDLPLDPENPPAVSAWDVYSNLPKTTFNFVNNTTPYIVANPVAVEFNDVEIGSDAVLTYTVSGANLTSDIEISLPPSSGFEISENGNTYGNNITLTQVDGSVDETTIYVKFTPLEEIDYSAVISHSSTGAATTTVDLSGTGVLLAPAVSTSFTSIDFNNVEVGTTAEIIYTVSGVNLAANIEISLPELTGFEISEDGAAFGTSLYLEPVGGVVDETTIHVRFSPIEEIDYSAVIAHTSTGAATSNVNLSGTGFALTPMMHSSATSIDFNNVEIGTTAELEYIISGTDLTGNIEISLPELTGFEISEDGAAFGTSLSLEPVGGVVDETTIYVRFSPTEETEYNEVIANVSTGAAQIDIALLGNGILGIAEVNKDNISVYPNPSTGVFNILTDQECYLEVLEVTGKVVYTQYINKQNTSINLTTADKGVYFMKFYNNNGVLNYKILVK